MREEWYVARRGEDGNKRYGPVPLSQLRDLLDAGDVRPDDLVWREGMAGWMPADQCDEINQPARPRNYYGYDRPPRRRPYRPQQPSSSGWVIPLVVIGGVMAVSILSCGGLVTAGILANHSSPTYTPSYPTPIVDPPPQQPAWQDPPPWQNPNFVPDPNPPLDPNPPVFIPPDPNPPIFVPPQDPDKNP